MKSPKKAHAASKAYHSPCQASFRIQQKLNVSRRTFYFGPAAFPMFYGSIVVAVNFKKAPGVQTGGTHLRGGSPHHDVAAVAAFPHLNFALFKDLGSLHIVQQGAVALLMALLNGATRRNLAANSGNPSSSAVLAKPSYISVHS